MRRSFIPLFVFLLSAIPLTAAEIDVHQLRTISLDKQPIQVVSTADGQRIYVLTESGDIQLFSANGDLLGSFAAGPDVSGMTPQGNNRLVLEVGTKKQLQIINLEPIVAISTTGSPSLGPMEAPVTIVVFDDFECPFCAKSVPLLQNAVAAFPEQVKLVFKHFPLSMHKHARDAAMASIAADQQGKFWELHDLLFANYDILSTEKISQLAEQAGLDMLRFTADKQNPLLQQKLTADQQEGLQVGVRGTPTIFVNGRRLPQRSSQALHELIRSELGKISQRGEP